MRLALCTKGGVTTEPVLTFVAMAHRCSFRETGLRTNFLDNRFCGQEKGSGSLSCEAERVMHGSIQDLVIPGDGFNRLWFLSLRPD